MDKTTAQQVEVMLAHLMNCERRSNHLRELLGGETTNGLDEEHKGYLVRLKQAADRDHLHALEALAKIGKFV